MKKLTATALLILALFATSCAASFDREAEIDNFVDEGFTREQATCIIDETIDEFGEDKLNSNDDPTPAEEDKLLEIAFGCIG